MVWWGGGGRGVEGTEHWVADEPGFEKASRFERGWTPGRKGLSSLISRLRSCGFATSGVAGRAG